MFNFRHPFARRAIPIIRPSANGNNVHLPSVARENVLVFPRSLMESWLVFSGFRTDAAEMVSRFLPGPLEFLPRSDLLETDETRKQVVAAVVPWDRNRRRVWCFRRGATEGRLEGLLSCLVGGHVSEVDRLTVGQTDPLDVIWAGAIREMGEEFTNWDGNWRSNHSDIRLTLAGVVNHEGDPVSRVHFGFVYRLDVQKPNIPLRFAKEAGTGAGWIDIDQVVDGLDVEPWSRHVARHLAESCSPVRL